MTGCGEGDGGSALLGDCRRWGSIIIIKCFFFNDTATTEVYTLSLHDALPISVIGAGTMGSGIAAQIANAGHDVMLFDLDRRAHV